MLEQLKRDGVFINRLFATLRRVMTLKAKSDWLVCDELDLACTTWPGHVAMKCGADSWSYADLKTYADRVGNFVLDLGLKRGETVALFMPNRPEYVGLWFGIAKAGVRTALINSNLQGAALKHSFDVSGAKHLFVDATLHEALETIRDNLPPDLTVWSACGEIEGARPLDAYIQSSSADNVNANVRLGLKQGDVALYIYTSGTTGLPKAAKVTHMKALTYMRGFAGGTGARPEDNIYITLPLYHATGGLCALGAALLTGGTAVLRERFSASQFWADVTKYNITMFVYIGELCRYLINQDERPGEDRHSIRLAFGNGLRPDVWAEMDRRFKIPRILEFYGSTEGNVSLLNLDGKQGAVGRIPRWLSWAFNVVIVKYNAETGALVRDAHGHCVVCKPGEVGEALGRIGKKPREAFVGYTSQRESQRKIAEDVLRKGDRWFRTGDLMKTDKHGYFYFVDRLGDTFRWKGENVATTEVEAALGLRDDIDEAIVYGVTVPHTEGKAGMAALVMHDEPNWADLAAHLDQSLPDYAIPLFIRRLPALETTGTFKYRKGDLAKAGYDPERLGAEVWVRDAKAGYTLLTPETLEAIRTGSFRV